VKYRVLGSTSLRVSVLGVGAWQLGGEWGHDYTQPEVDAILDQAAAEGINLIDTAECYGDHLSERLVGDYLTRRDRSRWIVATKFGHEFTGFLKRRDDFSAQGVARQLEASLKALRIDCVDLYQFHSGSDDAFGKQELWTMLQQQKSAGKIRHIGISIPGKGSELQARQARSVGAEVLQVVYNRLDRRAETMYLPHAERDNLGVLARVPLASGLLSGKYRPGATFSGMEFRATFDVARLQRDLEEVERLRATEVPAGVPMSQWALAWCLQNGAVTAAIPGCRNPAQVSANAAAVKLLGAGS
jgi:aryl-alcohol dehydrogenase-like predicted oxidoreductase